MSNAAAADPVAPFDAPGGGPNFLLAATRRWPWLLVGLGVGTLAGFLLLFMAKAPVYQSSAQVLVIKKRTDMFSPNDARAMFMEDYVATQVTLLRSERIMLAAAAKIDPKMLKAAVPEDKEVRSRFLQTGMLVDRVKDAASGGAGTNVLALTFRGADPDDCKAILDAIINTYQTELETVFDAETAKKLQLYESMIAQTATDLAAIEKDRSETIGVVLKITPEELTVIKLRVSKLMETKRAMEKEKSDLEGNLELVAKAPTDPRGRALILAQLADTGRGAAPGKLDVDNPDQSIKALQLERAEQLKKYNVEHQVIVALDAKIAFFKEMTAKPDAKDAAAPLDGLAIYGTILANRLKQTEKALSLTMAELKEDTGKLTDAGTLQNKIEVLTRAINDKTVRRDEMRTQKAQTEVTKNAGGYEAQVITRAERNGTPIAPKLVNSLLLGAVGGLLLGFGLASLAELADKSFRSPAEIRARLGLPVIGHIPPIRGDQGPDSHAAPGEYEPTLVTAVRPKSVEAEAYRGVRTSLYFSLQGRGHQVIQVTSPNPGDGKSTLAANLAVSIAQSGKRVILIDCDFRRPRMHKIFRIDDPGPGFVSVLIGEATMAQAVLRTPIENLTLLPCGVRPANPAELLTSPQFVAAIEKLRSEYEFVVLDTPPLLAVSDPSAVATRADGVILVFRMTGKARPQAERAREQLNQLGANVLGVVVNGAGKASDGYGYGTGAGYHYDYAYEYADMYTADDDADGPANLPRKG